MQLSRLKGELAEARAESVVLNRTEQVLKSRDDKLEDFLQKLEEEKVTRRTSTLIIFENTTYYNAHQYSCSHLLGSSVLLCVS